MEEYEVTEVGLTFGLPDLNVELNFISGAS